MKKLLAILIISLFFVSCETISVNTPPMPASFVLDLRVYTELQSLNSYILLPQGLRDLQWGPFGTAGLIVVHTITHGQYSVFDQVCRYPACEVRGRRVVMREISGFADCPACGSSYLLFTGTGEVIQGPATNPLFVYPPPVMRGNDLMLNYIPR